MIVWLAVVLWLVIVGWSLALMRAAGTPEDLPHPGPEEPAPLPERPPRMLGGRRRRALVIGQCVLLGVVGIVAVASPTPSSGSRSSSSACSRCS